MKKVHALLRSLSVMALAGLLASCGGGSSDSGSESSAADAGPNAKAMAALDGVAPVAAPQLVATWSQLPNPNYAPPAGPYGRVWTEMTWDSQRGEMVIWGGNGGVAQYNNDMWSYNAGTGNWTQLDPYTACPGTEGFTKPNGSDDSAFKYDPVNNLYWLFGVTSGYRCDANGAVRTAATGTTTTSIVDPNLAGATDGFYTYWHVLAGGFDVAITGYNAATKTLTLASPIVTMQPGTSYQLYASTTAGVWYFDPATSKWTGQNPPSGSVSPNPGARRASSTAYSTADQAFILWGGALASFDDPSVWKLDVNTKLWTKLPAPAVSPSGHGETLNSMVYDKANDVFIMFGGMCNDVPKCATNSLGDETWVYSLKTNTWRNMKPSVAPSARAKQVMTYDEAAGVTVLFGGLTTDGNANGETWYYHYPSNTWKQLQPAVAPLARYLGQITYDPVRKRSVVFGGSGTGVGAEIWALTLTPSDVAPTVSLTTPTDGSTVTGPASVSIQAAASSANSTITKVEFYAGSTKIGESASAPYAFNWTSAGYGSYYVTAVATDANGIATTSAPALITINPAGNSAPSVVLSTASVASTSPATVTLGATATDAGGSISKVEFFAGTTKIGQATASPYTISWTTVPAGTYSITARATDNLGAIATSAAVSVTVNPPAHAAPTVALSAPLTDTTYGTPATVTLTATAADSDGAVVSVDFYNGGTKIGTATSAPYTFNWTNVAAGSYTLTAVATDDGGFSTTSTAVSIRVVDATPPAPAVNVALAANGGVASASSIASTFYPVNAINDGDRRGNKWSQGGTGSGWSDATAGAYPDWAQITFSGTQTISQINVYTLADNYASLASDPNGASTFTQYGITAFQVQYWTGSAWANVPGGTVVGNNRVLRSFSFAPISTDRIRVLISGALGLNSRIVEIEAWSGTATPGNVAPSVSITAPANGTSYTTPASITLTATAADSDGSIASVDFYAGATKIGTATSAPYSVTWSGMAAGTYSITAVATDNQGATTTSAAVGVIVTDPSNSLPTVTLTAPASGTSYTAPASITLTADAADTDGTITKVDFYAGATKLGTATSAPYSFSWTNVAAGSYTITAVATDNRGATATSQAASVTVSAPPNNAPTVSLSAPNGASYTSPATIALAATAADSDGSIAKVEFFMGATKIATVTSAPYNFSWTNVAAGTYTLTAVATDNAGASTTSSPITVTVTDVSVPAGAVNVALASNGGVASASSTINSSYPVSAINDGDRRGNKWGQGGTGSGWNDATSGVFPDWAQITFSGTQTISQINVYTLADNYASLSTDPTTSSTFAQYGITAFEVQYWTGSAWVDVPGGNVTGNNRVLRSFSFAPISTDRIRVLVSNALYYNSRIVELEAWSTNATPGNVAPSVSITAPANGTSYTTPASITLTATAADSDGSIASVDFYAGATKIGTATSAPYSVTWSGMAAGTYSITAVATDNQGATTTSAAVGVIVTDPSNSLPTVTLTAPASGTSYTAPASITLSADAADTDGTITKVDFYAGATKLGTATSAPYSFSWTNVAAGSYTITAVATDNRGATATSQAASVTVSAPPNNAPTVSLSAPNGASYTSPATIALAATAADSDGSIAKVEFFMGATKIATVTSAPYNFSWTNVAAGTYTLTAVATDNAGASTTSSPITVTVTDVSVPAGAVNVALASNGGVASASSITSTLYPASSINDGDRRGNKWGQGTGGWGDGTSGTYPDWAQVTFSGTQTISQINVYTLADNYASLATDPTSSTAFTKYGIVDFQVQYWTGTAWQNVPGGSITGNSLVLRSVSFAPISTDRIRVYITNALYWNSRIVELEAWAVPQ